MTMDWDRWFFFIVFGGFLFLSLCSLVLNAKAIRRVNDNQPRLGWSVVPDDVRAAARDISAVIDGDKRIHITLEVRDRD